MSRRLGQAASLRARDALDRLTGRHDPLVPPRRMWFIGPGDFRVAGDEFLSHFVELAGLRPGERVLDVGSGIGRMARPLASFLGPDGRYDGFDVVPEAVAWCRRAYAGHPNFRFQVVDVRNDLYNGSGAIAAADLRFPYADEAFDFAFATSVFTHMLPPEVDHYLAELARVLRPGGRCLLTFFLLDADSRRAQAQGGSRFDFEVARGPAAIQAGERAEAAVAYEAGWVSGRLAAHGFLLREPVVHGTWAGSVDGRSLQDIVVADRGDRRT